MNALRELRRDVGLKQKEFASMLQVPLEILRTWDSGRRAVPGHILANAMRVIAEYPRNAELLSLDVFALELVFTNDLLHELAVSWCPWITTGSFEACVVLCASRNRH